MAGDRIDRHQLNRLLSRRLTRAELLRAAAAAGLTIPAASLLAACGGGGEEEAGTGPVEISRRFEGQELRFLAAQPQAGAAKILAPEFERLTGAKVTYTSVPYDQIQSKATLDVQSGANEFDVYQYWYTSVGALAEQGVVEDLTEWIENDPEIQPDDFIQSIYDPYTLWEGRRYGLPFDGDYHILFYNTEVFERNGLEPPRTWDEYTSVAREITRRERDRGIYGCALLGRKTAFDIGSSYFNRLAGFGGRALTEDGQPALNTDAAVAAAEAMAAVAEHALPTPLQTGFDTALPQWQQGKVAMMEFWTDLGPYSQAEGSKVIDKWGCAPLPVGGSNTQPASALNAGWAFAVSKGARNKELARAFVKFAASRETNLKLITTTGSGLDPNRNSTLNDPSYKDFQPQVQPVAAKVANRSMSWPTTPEAPRLINALNDELALMLQGNKSPKDAVRAIQEQWERILG